MHTKNLKDKPNTNESSKFKVLLIYANKMMENLISINVSILSAALKQHGFDVKLFDTTFYRTEDESVYDIRVNNLQVRKFDLSSYGIKINDSDIHEDLIKLVEEYKPNLVGLSAVEETYLLGLSLLKSIKSNFNIPTIVGGVHTIFSPEEVLAQDDVDMICIGEGEEALVELCQKMQNGEDYYKVKNIWFKKDGVAVKNPRRDLMPLKDLPFLDFSIYDKRRMYRPMQGKIYKMLPIESSRGCPYTCTYCSASTLRKLYSNLGNYYRRKSVEQIIKEIQHYRKQYGLDFVYFTSESFLSMPDNEFENFVELYSEIKLPFWLQTRPESITKERIKKLETINCNRISVGLESGNEQLRKKMLKRNISNQQIIESLDVFKHSKIPLSVNSMIGFPDETREQIFDTINLNRIINADSSSLFIYTPYRGSELRQYCIEKGYVKPDLLMGSVFQNSILKMPQITNDEIKGLFRTFSLYIKLPEEYYPDIQIAEKFDKRGNEMFEHLSKVYVDEFFK
ncbi:MAG: radical SAM protein [Candidatus Methanoperedens sp.]|nr:radical SAM protein [Candidatus Methanoperedens sp.]MCZ7394907.1 radical SAM protein [Candidatus Methanoperedens sp.]